MLLKDLFKDITLSLSFEGWVTADNMVLAVDVSKEQNADVDDYAVAQMGLKSTSGSLNPEEKTNSYIRAGKSTTKTGNQRTVGFDADRYKGDAFQDFALSHEMKYAIGDKAVVNYAYFDNLTGKGEKGTATLIIDTDASGNAEENLSVSGSLKKIGAAPAEFTYEGFGGYTAVKEQPSDWTSAYATYFIRSNGAFTAVTGDSAPEWAEGRYYSKKAE